MRSSFFVVMGTTKGLIAIGSKALKIKGSFSGGREETLSS